MKLLRFISKIFFPERCSYCQMILPLSDTFCLECESKSCHIPEDFCLNCNSRECVCNDGETTLRHLCAAFIYTGAVRKAIISFKFRKEKHFGDFFSDSIFKSVLKNYSDTDFDLVTFVPMSKDARKQRSYNQSEILASKTAKRLFIPCEDTLTKSKTTLKQHRLSRDERKENIRDAFSLKKDVDISGKTILLCDDIKTTGSTLLACEKVLLEGGAKDVYCAVVALPVYGNAAAAIDKEEKNI